MFIFAAVYVSVSNFEKRSAEAIAKKIFSVISQTISVFLELFD